MAQKNGTKLLLIPLHHRHSGVLSKNPSSRNPWPLWWCRAMNNSKSWTKVGQNWIWTISWQKLDKQFYPTLNSQNLDKTWTFMYPMFVWYEKLWTKKYTLDKTWTITKILWQNMDNYLTKLSKIEILLTNIGHGQNLDKHWTETGQNLDICQKIVQILSNPPFYRSTA